MYNYHMSSWSQRRQFTYGSIVAVILIALISVPLYSTLHHAPTCSDGVRNGDEEGVDCGGACERMCTSSLKTPSASWTRLEQVSTGVYNVATYIINPNTFGQASNVPFHITLYDNKGMRIIDVPGTVTIPPHRNTLAFLGSVKTGSTIPVKAVFEFSAAPEWYRRTDPLSDIHVANQNYTEKSNSSSLQVTLANTNLQPMSNVAVYAVLYDRDGNALGFSKTILDTIPGNGSTVAPFTWPVSHFGKVISIEVLPVAQ